MQLGRVHRFEVHDREPLKLRCGGVRFSTLHVTLARLIGVEQINRGPVVDESLLTHHSRERRPDADGRFVLSFAPGQGSPIRAIARRSASSASQARWRSDLQFYSLHAVLSDNDNCHSSW